MDSRDAKSSSPQVAVLGSHRVNIAAIVLGTLLVIIDGSSAILLDKKVDLFEVVMVFAGGMGTVSAIKIFVIACDPKLSQMYGGETGSAMFLGGLILAIVSIGGVVQLISS